MGVGADWRNLRVLVVSRGLYPPDGGGELSLLATVEHLRLSGASVSLLYHGSLAVPGIATHFLPEMAPASGMWLRQILNYQVWKRCIAKHLRDTQPDIVVTQQETSAAVVAAARAEGVRSVVMIRGTDFLQLPALHHAGAWRHYLQAPAFFPARRCYLRSLKRADAVIANSRFIRSVYEPLTGRPVDVVYPAVETRAARVNHIDGHFVMFTPHAHKGGHVLLEMACRMPEASFVVAGNGDPEIVEPLRQLANVQYLGWTDRPERLFEGACATLVPTQMPEAFGRVAVESMARGVPVLASHCGGLPEAVGAAGVLVVQSSDPVAWCDSARALRADAAQYRRMSHAAVAQAALFDAARQMANFDAILSRTLDAPRRARVSIAGVPVDPVTLPQACREIERACRSGRQLAVTTVNAEFIVQSLNDQSLKDQSFRGALRDAALAVPDSFGITLALAWRGLPMGRCPGVDLVQQLARASASSGLRLFFLGSTEAVLLAAAGRLRAAFPGACIGIYAPPFGDLEGLETENMIAAVNAFRPDVLLVAIGAPRQEVWIARHLPRLAAHVAVGVGGSFDMISGRMARCPALMGRLGLEWAYRLMLEPTRWRRCLRLARFLPIITGDNA